jgi:hypothetical protein
MTPKSLITNRESFRKIGSLLLLLTLIFGPGSAFSALAAQEVTGNVQGEVKDPTGAVISNATVTAASQQRTFTATTDESGMYRFNNLLPGVYTITATASGFSKVSRENITVEIGRTLQVNFDLTATAAGETVTVTSGQDPIVDVSSSKTATNISQEEIELLPKANLNFSSVLEVAPGTRSESKAAGFQIDGASGSENVFVVDGVEVTEFVEGRLRAAKNIPLDFVREVQVKSAGYEAEFGGATGGVINVVTRPGTNEFHGEMRFEYTSDRFRAKDNPALTLSRLDPTQQTIDYFTNPSGKDQTRFFSPIFSLGGPIIKDKLLFYASYAPQYTKLTRRVDLIAPIATGDTQVRTLDSRRITQRTKIDYSFARLDFNPSSKLQVYGSFINSPVKTEGILDFTSFFGGTATSGGFQTTSDFAFRNPRYDFQGGYSPSWQTGFGANYSVTPNLILSFRGGYSYFNDKGGSYDIPTNTPFPIISAPCTSTTAGPGTVCSPGTTTTGNPTISTNQLTSFDILKRTNLNFDASYIKRLFGQQHAIKGGYQVNRLSNDVLFGFSGGRFQFFFNRTRAGQRGAYGFYVVDEFARSGAVNSTNQGLFIQDAWQIHPRVTLNLGVRIEKEFLPSFPITPEGHPDVPPDAEVATKPISFGWGDKVAPRIGAAVDVFGDGRLKLSGSYSVFFDTMKYELPRGSFGGEVFLRTFRRLETSDFRSISLSNQPGAIIEGPFDLRFPTNVTLPGERPGIDPNLKPYREHEFSFAADYALQRDFVVGARFTRKELDRAIEDIGGTDAQGNEIFTIGNPGFGTSVDFFDPPTPKAIREYTGLEIRADKRFGTNGYLNASYIRSKLFGNYSGLASSDENGRTSPNVNRYFDLPFLNFDTTGQTIVGRLATDRPNTFKFFGGYRFGWNVLRKGMQTDIGMGQLIYQGIPLTSEFNTVVTVGNGAAAFLAGRGDIGRTPWFTQTDLNVTQFIPVTERVRVLVRVNVFNLWDERNVTDQFRNFLAPGQSVLYPDLPTFLNSNNDFLQRIAAQHLVTDPRYRQPNAFQSPREARFAVGIQF